MSVRVLVSRVVKERAHSRRAEKTATVVVLAMAMGTGCLFPSLDGLSGDAGADANLQETADASTDAGPPGDVGGTDASTLELHVPVLADSWVRAGSSVASNKGTDPALYATSLDTNGAERRIFLKFDVDGTLGRVPKKAVLRVRCVRSSASGGALHLVPDTSWNELVINWNNQPAMDAAFTTQGAVVEGTMIDFDVTSVIKGDGVIGLGITKGDAEEVQYASREGTTAPELIVAF